MSRNSLALSGAVSLALAVVLTSGCKSPQVLEDRGSVPPPAMTPADAATVEGMSNQPLAPVAPSVGPGAPALSAPFAPGKGVAVAPPPPVPAAAKAMPIIPDFNYDAFKSEQLSYTVKHGDSLWTVARMYGVTVSDMARVNKLPPQKALRVGQVLQIPEGGALVSSSEAAAPAAKGVAHVKGAKSHAVSAPSGKPVLSKGAALAKTVSEASAPGAYTVKSGDNPALIAKRHHVMLKELLAANKWTESKRLRIGEKVVIPGKAGASVASAAPHAVAAKKGAVAAKKVAAAAPAAASAAAPAGKEIKSETDITAEEKTTTTTAAGGEEEIDEFLSADSKTDKKGKTTTTEELEIKVDDSNAAGAAAPKAKEPSYLPHPVNEAGVTFSKLSEMYGVKIEKLKEANPGLPADKELPIGTKVRIPEE